MLEKVKHYHNLLIEHVFISRIACESDFSSDLLVNTVSNVAPIQENKQKMLINIKKGFEDRLREIAC